MRTLALIIGAIVCLLIGLYLGDQLAKQRSAPAPTAIPTLIIPTVTPATLPPIPSDPVSLLLLCVDSRQAVQPKLEGVWVFKFTPGTDRFFLLGYPPTMPISEGHDLQDYYDYAVRLSDYNFMMDAMRLVMDRKPQHYLILERSVLIEITDSLGGVILNGETLSGAAMVERFDSLDTPQARIEFQQAALYSLTLSLKTRALDRELLLSLYNRYQTLSPSSDELLTLAIQSLPISNADFVVEIAPVEPR